MQQASPDSGTGSQADAIGQQLAAADAALTRTEGQVEASTAQLRRQAVGTFVDGGSADVTNQVLNRAQGYDTSLGNEYLATLNGNVAQMVRRLAQARDTLKAEQSKLEAQEQFAQAVVAAAANPHAAVAVLARPGQTATPSLSINGPEDFAVALLNALGDTITSANVAAIVAWCQHEGGGWGNVAQFNPLNTSMRMPASHAINGDGVQSYTSWSEGLTATVATLNSGSYRGILSALSNGSSVSAVENAIAASPWGTHF